MPLTTDEFNSQLPLESGVYDKNNDLQFVGISREHCGQRFLSFKIRAGAMLLCQDEPDRTALTQAWKSWVEEHLQANGKVPPGNESGNTTWVQQPPKKKPDLRLTPGRHVQLTIPLEELIDELVKENKVVASIKGSGSAPMCGFSQRVIGNLES